MASPRGRPARPAGPTLAACVEEARGGSPAPVYLLDGDAFLSARGARELAAALVPEAQRSLSVVDLDAAASPAEVAQELATRPLFGGRKVVVVHEPAFLQSKDDAADAFARAQAMWAEGRQREAARRLLALAAKAGWSAKDLEQVEEEAWREELGVKLDGAAREFVAGAARFALEREMKAAKDDSAALDALLARGLPEGHVLVIAAGKVDGRLPLVKKLAGAGRRVPVAVEKQGTWTDERPVLGPVLTALLAGTGKSVDRGAEARLAELVGDDARTLSQEVAKLAAWVGDRKVIRADDVDQVVVRVAQDPFFALGNAVESRDLEGALGVLDRTLRDGGSIHMVLGSLAGTVRRLVVESERARIASGGERLGSYDAWSALVLPAIPEDELAGKKPYGFWMKYQASTRFSREELLDALAGLAEADRASKLGGDGRLLVERVLLRLLSNHDHPRSHA